MRGNISAAPEPDAPSRDESTRAPPPIPSRFLTSKPPRAADGARTGPSDTALCNCRHPSLDRQTGSSPLQVQDEPARRQSATAKTILLSPALVQLRPYSLERPPSASSGSSVLLSTPPAYRSSSSPTEYPEPGPPFTDQLHNGSDTFADSSQDPEIHGVVELTLPRAQRLKKMYETAQSTNNELSLNLEGQLFPCGRHRFRFQFVIPSCSTPSISSEYGRCFYRIRSTVCIIKRGSITSKISPPEIDIALVVAPDAVRLESDMVLDTSDESFSDELGPYRICVRSNSLSVSGLLRTSVCLLSPINPIAITSVTARIVEECTITSLTIPKTHPSASVPDERRPLGPFARWPHLGMTGSAWRRGGTTGRVPLSSIVRSGRAVETGETSDMAKRKMHPREKSLFAVEPAVPSPDRTRCGDVSAHHATTWSGGAGLPAAAQIMNAFGAHRSARQEGDQAATSLPSQTGSATALKPHCLARLKVGQRWKFNHEARLPSCKSLRPSTHSASQTPFDISHQIVVEIAYVHNAGGGQDMPPVARRLRISKPVHVYACTCLYSNLVLPTYERPNDVAPLADSSQKAVCACHLSTEALAAAEQQATNRGGGASEDSSQQPLVVPASK